MPTLSSDPLDILLAHDAWATRLILERCRSLSHEQFHRRFDIGMGSLHDNLTHIVGVVRRWTDRFAVRPLRPALAPIPERPDIPSDGKDRTPDELLAMLDEAAADLKRVVSEWRAKDNGKGLATTLSLEWPDKDGGSLQYTFTRATVLVHVATHGVHHRAQCINMLRHLNVPGLSDPPNLPDPSVVDWCAAVESPPVKVR